MTLPQAMLYGACLVLSLGLCVGQVLFKMASLGQPRGGFAIAVLFTSPWFLAAVALYGLTTILWVYILTRMPLSVAYPFSFLSAALVPLAAHFLFGEPLTAKIWIGMALVFAGLYVMNAT